MEVIRQLQAILEETDTLSTDLRRSICAVVKRTHKINDQQTNGMLSSAAANVVSSYDVNLLMYGINGA